MFSSFRFFTLISAMFVELTSFVCEPVCTLVPPSASGIASWFSNAFSIGGGAKELLFFLCLGRCLGVFEGSVLKHMSEFSIVVMVRSQVPPEFERHQKRAVETFQQYFLLLLKQW